MNSISSNKSSNLSGVIIVPGDKSISHRALIIGSLVTGKVKIKNLLESDDVIATLEALKTLGIKIQREKLCGISTKEQILSWVKTQIPGFAWPTKILKSGPRKGVTISAPACYDIADSFVVAKSGFVKSTSA